MKRRNIIHRHAKLRSGAGIHRDKRRDNFREEMQMEMTLAQFREEHSIYNGTDLLDAVSSWSEDDKVPSLCRDGCEVDRGGHCQHGCPSILVKLGKA